MICLSSSYFDYLDLYFIHRRRIFCDILSGPRVAYLSFSKCINKCVITRKRKNDAKGSYIPWCISPVHHLSRSFFNHLTVFLADLAPISIHCLNYGRPGWIVFDKATGIGGIQWQQSEPKEFEETDVNIKISDWGT